MTCRGSRASKHVVFVQPNGHRCFHRYAAREGMHCEVENERVNSCTMCVSVGVDWR